jgi:hypothetical protein
MGLLLRARGTGWESKVRAVCHHRRSQKQILGALLLRKHYILLIFVFNMICVLSATISLSQGRHIVHELLYHPKQEINTHCSGRQNLFDYRLAMFLVLLVQLNLCEALSHHCYSDPLSLLISHPLI